MILYCTKCKHLTNSNRCENCRSRRIAAPTSDSPVFLIAQTALWAGMIEDVLSDHKIPHYKKIAVGDGITESILGYGIEKYSFYVPYAHLEAAHEIIDPLFTPVEDNEIYEE